jgi:HEAT repeat protein
MNTRANNNGNTPGKKELAELVIALASDDGLVRQHAREKLTSIGTPAVELLIKALDDHREQVRWEAAKALIVIADHRAAHALIKSLQDEDFDVRWVAAEALVALQEKALPALLTELEDHADIIQLREGAHHVLKKLEHEQVARILEPVIQALDRMDPELTVPIAARAAMKALQSQNIVLNQ